MKRIRKTCPNDYEHAFWKEGMYVVGLDEAGRGPLAGPLSAAGVIFPIGYENPDSYDSKTLSEKKRDALYETIMEDALWFEIVEVDVAEIDRLNIYRADQKAFADIAADSFADVILTDAMPLPEEKREVVDLVKGDQKSISIAAASILAKVTRDRIMKAYDEIYPQYGFAKNKGYGTKQHMEAIDQYGITPINRRSFAPVLYRQEKLDLF